MAKLIESDLSKEASDLVDTLLGMYDDYGYFETNSILFLRLSHALKRRFPNSKNEIIRNLIDHSEGL